MSSKKLLYRIYMSVNHSMLRPLLHVPRESFMLASSEATLQVAIFAAASLKFLSRWPTTCTGNITIKDGVLLAVIFTDEVCLHQPAYRFKTLMAKTFSLGIYLSKFRAEFWLSLALSRIRTERKCQLPIYEL